MYTTLKVHIKASQFQKNILLEYEKVFNAFLERLHNHSKSDNQYYQLKNCIHSSVQWYLRNYLKKHPSHSLNSGNRSSIWPSSAAKIDGDRLTLIFNKNFQIPSTYLHLSLDNNQIDYIKNRHITRIDLLHNGTTWLANILLFEESKY